MKIWQFYNNKTREWEDSCNFFISNKALEFTENDIKEWHHNGIAKIGPDLYYLERAIVVKLYRVVEKEDIKS